MSARYIVFSNLVRVLLLLGEDGCEGVNSIQFVVGDNHEQWEKGFPDG